MAENPIITVEAVSKAYRIWESPSARLISPMLESIGRNLPAGSGLRQALVNDAGRRYRDFWALRDVSFQVGRGECVGIIGRNGSGKSTLLQIIAGTLQPTTGTARVHGRVAALLELGSGFNPDFTGRENVYLNAAVLGLSRREVDERFDRIAAFADIGDFIDQPVKTYSSGMFVRLAFAVQTAVDPQILIVDEALSVGDVFFQQRCYERMRQLLDAGVCVVMASHDLGSVQQFCQRTLVFRQGRVAYHGPSAEATMMYFQIEQQEKASSFLATRETATAPMAEAVPADSAGALPFWPPESARLSTDGCRTIGNGWARCTYLAVCNQADEPWQHFRQGDTMRVYYEFEALFDMEYCTGSVTIRDKTAQPVHSRITLQDGLRHPVRVVKGTRLRFRQDTVLNLHCADYTLDVSLEMLPAALIARPGLSYDEYMQAHLRICELPMAATFTLRLRNETGPFQLLHFGMAGLPGTSMVEILPPPAQ